MADTNVTDFEVTVDGTTLKLHENEGEGNKVKVIRVHRDAEGPAQFELVVLQHTDEQPSTYPGADYKIGAEVKIKLGYKEAGIEEIFDGVATRADAIFHEFDSPQYRLSGFDRLHALTRSRSTQHWEEMKASEIASDVATVFGMSGDADATSEVFPHKSMNNETFYAFLQQLAEQNGRLLSAEGTKLLFKEHESGGSVATLKYGDNLKRARLTANSTGQISSVWVKGFDSETAAEVTGKAAVGDLSCTKGGSEWGAELVDSVFSDGPDERKNQVWVTDIAVGKQAAADDFAKSILNGYAENFCQVEAECEGDVKIQPHKIVTFEQVTPVFDGDWYVVSATHEFLVGTGPNKGFRTKFTARRGAWTPPA